MSKENGPKRDPGNGNYQEIKGGKIMYPKWDAGNSRLQCVSVKSSHILSLSTALK